MSGPTVLTGVMAGGIACGIALMKALKAAGRDDIADRLGHDEEFTKRVTMMVAASALDDAFGRGAPSGPIEAVTDVIKLHDGVSS